MVGRISELVNLTDVDDDLDEFELRDQSDTVNNDVQNKAWTLGNFKGILPLKTPVRTATTVNGALATAYENTDVVDGTTLATGDRILLKNQTAGAENGIYTVNASGAPTRALDFDTSAKVKGGMVISVQNGTQNKDSHWIMTNDGTITVGTTALVFVPFIAGALIMAEKAVPPSPAVDQVEIYNFNSGGIGAVRTKDEFGLIDCLSVRARPTFRKQFYIGLGSDTVASADLINYGIAVTTIDGSISNIAAITTAPAGKRFSTAATIDTQSGYLTTAQSRRDLNPDVIIKFRVSDTLVRRVWIGWVEATHMASDSTAATHKFALRLSTAPAVTGFTIVHSDGTTEVVEAQIQASDNLVHTIRIIADNANARFGYSFDGAAVIWITTNIPAATGLLLLQCEIRTLEAVAKNMDMFGTYGDMDV